MLHITSSGNEYSVMAGRLMGEKCLSNRIFKATHAQGEAQRETACAIAMLFIYLVSEF